jgi:hypothetical protein
MSVVLGSSSSSNNDQADNSLKIKLVNISVQDIELENEGARELKIEEKIDTY